MADPRAELARLLHAATVASERRTEVWLEIINPDGTIAGSIYRGAVILPESTPEEESK